MADYYYEARKHDKWLRRHAKENKARKERMKEFQRAHSRDHQQSLIIEGKPCKLYRDAAASSVEATLMPWNGRHDVLIDRFDARAVLDMVPLSPKDTGDHREKKGLETFLSFERYRGILDAQRARLGEREHTAAVSEQVREKLAEIARVQQGEPDEAEMLAAREAQNERYKKAETKAAMKEAKNAGVYGHYGPGGPGDGTITARGRGAEVALQYGGEVVGKSKGDRGGTSAPPVQPDEDEAQLDPEILALIEKEVGGGIGEGDSSDDSSDESDFDEDEDDNEDEEDDEDENNAAEEEATAVAQDRLGEEYGISEKRSGYSYSRLLRYERRHRAQQRAIRAEELESAKKRKKTKKKADGGGGEGGSGGHDDGQGHGHEAGGGGGSGSGGRRVTEFRRSRQGPSSLRGSPTYEDFVDPLEVRRQKRKEARLREGGGVGREYGGNGPGRGRQYISSFEVTDKSSSAKKGGSDSDGSLLDSDSDDDNGGSHLVLLEGFFPTLADSLRRHLQEKERRESELEAKREKERELERQREKERHLEHARRRAAARRRRSKSRSLSRSSSRDRGRGSSRNRGARGRRGRNSRSRSRSSSWSRDHGRNRGSKRPRRDDTSPRSSPSVGKKVSGSSSIKQANKAAAPKAEKKLTPMEIMKLRMRKALDSQLQKDKTAIAKKSSKENKMAQLDRRQQRLDDKQHERLHAKARRPLGSSSPSRSSKSRSSSRSRARGGRRGRSRSRSLERVRDKDDGGGRGDGGGARGASSRRSWKRDGRNRSGSSRSRSGSRSQSVPSASHRGSDRRRRRGGGKHDHDRGGRSNGRGHGRGDKKGDGKDDYYSRSSSDRLRGR